MKIKYFVISLFIFKMATASTDFLPSGNFSFLEFTNYQIKETLPPQIELSFQLACNQEFIKVVRIEKIEAKSGHTIIALGGIIKENTLSSCAGKMGQYKVDAGKTFSGKAYKIVKIKKHLE